MPCDCFGRMREAVILPAGPACVILAHDGSKSEINAVRTGGDASQPHVYGPTMDSNSMRPSKSSDPEIVIPEL